ncbi:MAG: ATP-grasp domain-containing protein [Bacteroidota bacterium]|jgi:D-alanine-D-alanine ligase
MTTVSEKPSVLVLYNHVGEDEYEKIKGIDPKTLDFEPEYDIHVATADEEYKAIANALQKEGHRVFLVNLNENIKRLQSVLQKDPPDVVFNLVEFFHDSPMLEPAVAGLFDLYDIAYTGCSPFTLNLCVRKGLAKQMLIANGIPTPKFLLLHECKLPKRHGLKYPLIVKPAREDASSGVDKDSVVHAYDALIARLEKLFKEFAPPMLIEEYIEGRELHVSILGNDPPKVLPVIEFDFSELPKDFPNIITYNAKWNPLAEEFHRIHAFCPAKLTKQQLKMIEQVSVKAYETLECRDYARLDLRLSKRNRAYVLEVNPNPDLTEGVSFMESAEKAGMTFSEVLSSLVEFAYHRKLNEIRHNRQLKESDKEKQQPAT